MSLDSLKPILDQSKDLHPEYSVIDKYIYGSTYILMDDEIYTQHALGDDYFIKIIVNDRDGDYQ